VIITRQAVSNQPLVLFEQLLKYFEVLVAHSLRIRSLVARQHFATNRLCRLSV
jgi:hypothetical protein